MIASGFLLIDKPKDLSSFDVLRRLKKTFYDFPSSADPAQKAFLKDLALGHCGTLDPFATGLLLVALGRATRLSQYFLGGSKTYRALLRFGEKTRSGDLTDPVIETTENIPTDGALVEAMLQSFVGREYLQTPPMSSAKKIDGQKLYALERRGITVEREAVPRAIHSAVVHSFTPGEDPTLDFEVNVQSGTYIRVLAEDLSEKCGSLGHLRELRRLGSSRFSVRDAVTLEALDENAFRSSAFIPFDDVFPADQCIVIDAPTGESLLRGQQGVLQKIFTEHDKTAFFPLKMENGTLLAIVKFKEDKGEWRTDNVFPAT